MAYIPGRSVIPQLLVRRERWAGGYKTRGIPLVYPGQSVQPDQPVIRLDKREPVEDMWLAGALGNQPFHLEPS